MDVSILESKDSKKMSCEAPVTHSYHWWFASHRTPTLVAWMRVQWLSCSTVPSLFLMKTFWLFQLCSSVVPIIIAPVGTSPSCTSTFHALANQNVTLRRSPLEVEGYITHFGVSLSCRLLESDHSDRYFTLGCKINSTVQHPTSHQHRAFCSDGALWKKSHHIQLFAVPLDWPLSSLVAKVGLRLAAEAF